MGAMGYLYWKIVTNHAKTALHKPITYFYLVILVIYFTVVPMSLRMTVELFHGDSAEGLVMVLTVLAFWMIPANLIAYSRRKGLVYRKADVHFLFPAPVGLFPGGNEAGNSGRISAQRQGSYGAGDRMVYFGTASVISGTCDGGRSGNSVLLSVHGCSIGGCVEAGLYRGFL